MAYYEDIFKEDDFHTDEGKAYVIETMLNAKKGDKSMFDEVVELIESITERAVCIDNWIVDLVLE